MKSLFALSIALVMLFGAATANGSILLYEDFDDLSPDWWHNTGDLWHKETYRSYSGTTSLAYNQGGIGLYNYDTGSPNWGVAYSAAIDVSGSNEVYLEFASWLETENAPGQSSYGWDTAHVQIYNADMNALTLYGTLTPDINYFQHSTWEYLYSIDLKPMLDGYGLSQFRVGFYFDTWDSFANDYEGWYIDDVLVYDDTTPPIPEPSTWMLLGTGLLVAVPVARRKLRR